MEGLKVEAVEQVTEREHPVAKVASRLGVATLGLYNWLRKENTTFRHRSRTRHKQSRVRRG